MYPNQFTTSIFLLLRNVVCHFNQYIIKLEYGFWLWLKLYTHETSYVPDNTYTCILQNRIACMIHWYLHITHLVYLYAKPRGLYWVVQKVAALSFQAEQSLCLSRLAGDTWSLFRTTTTKRKCTISLTTNWSSPIGVRQHERLPARILSTPLLKPVHNTSEFIFTIFILICT